MNQNEEAKKNAEKLFADVGIKTKSVTVDDGMLSVCVTTRKAALKVGYWLAASGGFRSIVPTGTSTEIFIHAVAK